MARNWSFPRWRFLVMQGVMWVVLLAAMATAVVIDRRIEAGLTFPLGEAVSDKAISVQFPLNWNLSTDQPRNGSTLFKAEDPAPNANRVVIVARSHLESIISPLEFVLRSELIDHGWTLMERNAEAVGGWPGEFSKWSQNDSPQMLMCVVITPTREAVCIQLQKGASPTGLNLSPADHALFEEIVQSVRFNVEIKPSNAPVKLSDGSTVSTPAEFITYPRSDDLDETRTIARQSRGDGWVMARIFPVHMTGPPSGDLVVGLAARDVFDPRHQISLGWLQSNPREDGPGIWRLDPQDSRDQPLLRRGYLLSTGSNNAGSTNAVAVLLTAVRPANGADLDLAWAKLRPAISVAPKPAVDLAASLSNGATLLAKMPGHPPVDADAWWLWSRDTTPIQRATDNDTSSQQTTPQALGWTQSLADERHGIAARRTLIYNSTSGLTQVQQLWSGGGQCVLRRFDTESDGSRQSTKILEQQTVYANPIVTHATMGLETLVPTTFPSSPAFAPSYQFPQLLRSVTSGSAAWYTDRFPGCESNLLPSPILVTATSVNVPNELHCYCVEAQINGTGHLSRWYFNSADGTFNRAEFSGDLKLGPTTTDEINHALGDDPRFVVGN